MNKKRGDKLNWMTTEFKSFKISESAPSMGLWTDSWVFIPDSYFHSKCFLDLGVSRLILWTFIEQKYTETGFKCIYSHKIYMKDSNRKVNKCAKF